MTASTISTNTTVSQRLMLGIAMLFLGGFMVWGVGFAEDARMHNAAHDTRHAIGFPCH